MPFSVKMAESQLALYKKEQRRQGRSKVRQALFIHDYIFHKYYAIYEEAAQLYNRINEIYPKKPDLRRTEEFKDWKRDVMGQMKTARRENKKKRHPYVFPSHANIHIAKCVDPNDSFTVIVPPESSNKVMQLRIPLMHPLTGTVTEEVLEPETLQTTRQTVTEEVLEPETLQTTRQTVTEEVLEPETLQTTRQTVTEEVLEPETLQTTSQTVTEEVLEPKTLQTTLQTVTEEVLEEGIGGLEPSLHEEISPEIIQKIIEELQADPEIRTVMTDIEEKFDLGMEVEISDDDRLEDEFDNLVFW